MEKIEAARKLLMALEKMHPKTSLLGVEVGQIRELLDDFINLKAAERMEEFVVNTKPPVVDG